MATKSPGIYFNEIDNTGYTNPKSTSGTTVAIIGYAKKGPIGVPTVITSYANFKSAFGTAVQGYYSGLAVRTILSSGGRVLFTRVADVTASPSNCVIKSATAGFNGYNSFSTVNDIMRGTSGYYLDSLYGFKVKSGDVTKKFFIETPSSANSSGTLTRRAILKQIQEQVGKTSGFYLAKLSDNLVPGLYSFELKINGTEAPGVAEEDRGFFVSVPANGGKNTLKQLIESRINSGTNSIASLTISASNSDDVKAAKDVVTGIKGTKKFNFVKGNTVNQIVIDFGEPDTGATIDTIVNELDSKLKNAFNTRCIFYENPEDSKLNEIVFVSLDGESIDIRSLDDKEVIDPSSEELETKITVDLFLSGDDKTVAGIAKREVSDVARKFFINKKVTRNQSNSRLEGIKISIDENLNTLKFETGDAGNGKKIEVIPTVYGNFIFGESKNCGAYGLGTVNGQDEIDVDVSISEEGKIKFSSVSSDGYVIEPPVISALFASDYDEDETIIGTDPNYSNYVKNLVDLLGADKPVTGNTGSSAESNDIIVITSKEKGSATDNIVVDTITTKSPFVNEDGTYTVRHDLTVTVDGILRETYSDISLNFEDVDNRFDTIINESEENGGSSYINILVLKNDFDNENVNLPDGKYFVGKAKDAYSVPYTQDIEPTDYAAYDYMVGTDGIPEDGGDDLFEKAMEPNVAPLSNIDLYDFHVLITPDNITETVQAAAITLCEFREDAMYIADPPLGLTRDGVVNWHNGRGYGRMVPLNSNYVATYWPWCKIQDATTSKFTWIMPSILMAAKYVEVDKSQGSWYAPAGDVRGVLGAADIEAYCNTADRDILYVDYNRVNPICRMQTGEIIVYGEKTAQRTNSTLTKIHTRRMLIQIKKQCRAALKGYIFEPNTASYLSQVNADVSAILEGYKAGGGISAYKVICDETNNPIEVRQQDIINVDIAIVPEGTIEQINITLSLNKTLENS